LTAAVAHCSTVYDDAGSKFQCRQDSLGSYLISYGRWPYYHTPLFGYWDSYEDRLAMLVEEPYSQLSLTTSMTYLVWLRVVIFAKNRQAHEKKAATH
jgi:hypothetical protein